MTRELATFAADHPRSRALHERARGSLLDGVPMNWMVRWAGAFPLFVESASGRALPDVDGHDYVDFCLGDTGAMAGHGPAPTIAAVERQLRRGITHDAPDRGRDRGPARSCAPVRPAATGSSRSPRPTRTASRSASPARSPAARRSSSTTTATTARSTRPSRSLDADGRVVPGRGNTGPAGRPGADHPGRAVQRRRRRSSAPSPTGTSRRSSSSRP